MEVVIEGSLEKCLSPNASEGKREWKKRYFVLRKALGSGTRVLEYYKDYNWRRLEPKGVLTLFAGFSLNIVPDSKKRFAFEVKTVDSTFVVAAPSEDWRKRWMGALQEESGVKSFVVKPDENPKLRALAEMRDQECTLQIAPCQVMLVSDSCILVSWPLSCIRRYRCKNAMFMLEVGHKAPTGEGLFRFFTHQCQQIFETLDSAVKERMTTRKYRSVSENDSGEISAGLVSPIDSEKENTIPRVSNKFRPPPSVSHADHQMRAGPTTGAVAEVGGQYSHLGFPANHQTPVSRNGPGIVSSQSYDHLTSSAAALPPDVISSVRHGQHRGSDSALIGGRAEPSRPPFFHSQSHAGITPAGHMAVAPVDTVGYSNLKFDSSGKPIPSNAMVLGRRQSDAREMQKMSVPTRGMVKSTSADQLSSDGIYDRLNDTPGNSRVPSGRPIISASPEMNLYDNLNHLGVQPGDSSPAVISFWKSDPVPNMKISQRQGGAYQTTTLLNKDGEFYDSLNHHQSTGSKPFSGTSVQQMSEYDTPRISNEPIYQNTSVEEPKPVSPQLFNFKEPPVPRNQKPANSNNPCKAKLIFPSPVKTAPGVAPKPKPSGQDGGALVAQLKKNLQIKGFNPVKPPREGTPEPIGPSPPSPKPPFAFAEGYTSVGDVIHGEYGNIGFGSDNYATVGEVFNPTQEDNLYADVRGDI